MRLGDSARIDGKIEWTVQDTRLRHTFATYSLDHSNDALRHVEAKRSEYRRNGLDELQVELGVRLTA